LEDIIPEEFFGRPKTGCGQDKIEVKIFGKIL